MTILIEVAAAALLLLGSALIFEEILDLDGVAPRAAKSVRPTPRPNSSPLKKAA